MRIERRRGTRLGAVAAIAVAVVLAAPGPSPAADELHFETEDWIFTAPAVLGTQAELELNGRQVQRCSAEIERLIGYRPTNVAKFTWTWVIDGASFANATPTGVVSHVPSAEWPLVDPVARSSFEDLAAAGLCFGPHEVTHVLTWESWGPAWANEGFAQLTDYLYGDGWRCCSTPPEPAFSCDTTGYTWSGVRYAYTNLRDSFRSIEYYNTAACLWLEVHARGGFAAIRKVLAGMRAHPPASNGAFVEELNAVLGDDLRPVLMRYGFTAEDLARPRAQLAAALPALVPGRPRTGQTLTVRLSVIDAHTDRPIAGGSVSCRAKVGRRGLRAVAKGRRAGTHFCAYRLPRSAKGKTVSGSIAVAYDGDRLVRVFSRRVR